MSHLLRELTTESELMKAGKLPKPTLSVELTEHIVALRAEIAAALASSQRCLAVFAIKFEQ
jgi:hypothetical protein